MSPQTPRCLTKRPELEFERAACPRCGSTTAEEAETRCQPSFDETGEAYCPAESEDEAGNLLQPTAESLAALDAYYGELAKLEAEQ